MKVFISIPWFVPAYRAGGPIQSIANLVEQCEGEFEFYIFTSVHDIGGEVIPVSNTDSWISYNTSTQVYYASGDKINQKLTRELEKIRPQTLMMIGLYSWNFTVIPLFFGKAETKIISVRGMLHPGALSTKTMKKNLFISALKLSGITGRAIFQATDELESKHIKEVFGQKAKVQIANNFPRKISAHKPATKLRGKLNLVSICVISPMKNLLLVLQALQQCAGEIVYHIYGPVKDKSYWQQCLLAVAGLPAKITFTYHGECLPADVPGILSNAHIFILPSKSENYGHSIVEALSASLPVITSNSTPWNNLEEWGAGKNVEPDATLIANAIQHYVHMDMPAYTVAAHNAKAYSNEMVNLPAILEQHMQLLNRPAEEWGL